MTQRLNLKCRRRLTLREGRTILKALDIAKIPAKLLRKKLAEAIHLVTHKCDKKWHGRCSVCLRSEEGKEFARRRNADTFRESLRMAKELQERHR